MALSTFTLVSTITTMYFQNFPCKTGAHPTGHEMVTLAGLGAREFRILAGRRGGHRFGYLVQISEAISDAGAQGDGDGRGVLFTLPFSPLPSTARGVYAVPVNTAPPPNPGSCFSTYMPSALFLPVQSPPTPAFWPRTQTSKCAIFKRDFFTARLGSRSSPVLHLPGTLALL